MNQMSFSEAEYQHLAEQGLFLREGTIVDVCIIEAPFSTKNKSGRRDPEAHQTRNEKKLLQKRFHNF